MSRQMLRTISTAAGLLLLAAPLPCVADDVPHVVHQGENPWTISMRYLRSMALWPRLVSYNRIADPLRIAPGTVLRIPEGWLARRKVSARVLAVEGQVSWSDARDRPTRVRAGDTIPVGALVRTGALDSLSLGLLDDSRVLVKGDSELSLESNAETKHDRTRSILLDLRRGALENDVEKRSSSGGRFEIRTPAGIAAVRGTAFRVTANQTKTSTEVLAGAVALQNRAGAVDVAAGFATSATPHSAPEAPRALLPAPDLAGFPQRIERVPSDLPIPPLAGASAYRTQIATDASFAALLFDQTAPLPVARVRDLPDGEYQLRVRGIDDAGFEGYDARHGLVIDARPEPPFLIAPPDDAGLGEARPSFKWTGRQTGSRYRFQLAQNPSFAQPLVDRPDVDGDGITVAEDMLPGTYYWRVAASNAHEGQGPFSPAQHLRRLPGAPAIELLHTDQKPAIRWRPGGPDERFQLQVARDPSFAEPLVDMTMASPEQALPALEGGSYNLRARTIAGDGYVGEWGPVQQFEVRSGLSPALLLLLLPLLLAL
ncbi:MAG: FecR domain-containing protein [Sterolibacteriaceae bacterium]|nr:FecR domain-containing protein [Sterolibacteriaceae bacterium]